MYWKKASFIVLMLILPGGLLILGLCAAAWALNWEKEMGYRSQSSSTLSYGKPVTMATTQIIQSPSVL